MSTLFLEVAAHSRETVAEILSCFAQFSHKLCNRTCMCRIPSKSILRIIMNRPLG